MDCFLGNIVNKEMQLSGYGKIVENEIVKIPEYHKRAILDEWVVMPNHFHCIIILGGYDFDNGIATGGGKHAGVDGNVNVEKIHEFSLPMISTPPPLSKPTQQPWWFIPDHQPTINEIKQYRKHRRNMIIPKILGKLQMQTSKQINLKRNTPGIKNWQPDYHDHIIRDDESYERIKQYIKNNPRNWNNDTFNVKKDLDLSPKNQNKDTFNKKPVKKIHEFSLKNNGGTVE